MESGTAIGVLIKTVADDGAIKATQAELTALEEKSKATGIAAAGSNASFENFGRTLKTVGGQVSTLGGDMTRTLTLPIAAIGFESVKMAMNFQQTMEMLHTNAGVAQESIKGLSDQVLKLAPEVGAGPEALATALYHIESAGNGIWDTAKQMDILKIAAEGAAIGQASLDDTTYSLTSAMASNVSGAKDASEMMAVLTATVGAGDMKLNDLNAAIGTGFLGTAATFGISIQSVGAALATLTDNGEHADAAATRLRMTWALMTAPSKQAAGLLGDLGLDAEDAAKSTQGMSEVFAKTGLSTTKLADDLRQPNGITVALRDLQTHLHDAGLTASETDAVLSKTFGGGRTDAALLTMLQNLDRMDEKYKLINENTTKFGDNWAAQQQTAKQQWDKSWAGIQADMTKLGTAIMPAASRAMDDLGKAVGHVSDWFGSLDKAHQQFVLDSALVVAAMGPVLSIFGSLAKSISNIIELTTTLRTMLGVQMVADAEAGAAGTVGALGRIAAYIGGAGGLMAVLFGLGGVLNDLLDKYDKIGKASSTAGANSSKTGTTSSGNSLSPQDITHIAGHASGTNYAEGGWSWMGENGPEMVYLPRGSQVKTNAQSGSTYDQSNHSTTYIDRVILSTGDAVREFFNQSNQDTMNLSKGIATNQGAIS